MNTRRLANMIKYSQSTDRKANVQAPYSELERSFLQPSEFYNELIERDIKFFTGVPDSLLKDFCAYVTDNTESQNHIIAANEGSAVGIGAGYYLATDKYPLVYLQNSGLGNIVNPIMSLCHNKVYKVPMLLMIGWRGEPGKKDEPQHIVQGKSMNGFLTEMGIQFDVLPDYLEGAREVIDSAIYHMNTRQSPYAIIVKRQVFNPYKLQSNFSSNHSMNREQALDIVLKNSKPYDIFVGTTGFLSRELEDLRNQNEYYNNVSQHVQQYQRDFLCVGSMGHASSIAYGIGLQKQSRRVFCLDGDGSIIMHMGGMTQVGQSNLSNYYHVMFNNGVHDSVGSQPTTGLQCDFHKIAEGCGYRTVQTVDNEKDLEQAILSVENQSGPHFIQIKICPGVRSDLSRPKQTPQQLKEKFMKYLQL